MTPFSSIYSEFFNRITDDLYITMTPEQTEKDLYSFMKRGIIRFSYCRNNLAERTETTFDDQGDILVEGYFDATLTDEEIEILASWIEYFWLSRQVTDLNVIRLAFTDGDFEKSSQANHLEKLLKLKNNLYGEVKGLQQMYTRVKDGKPQISTIGVYNDE